MTNEGAHRTGHEQHDLGETMDYSATNVFMDLQFHMFNKIEKKMIEDSKSIGFVNG